MTVWQVLSLPFWVAAGFAAIFAVGFVRSTVSDWNWDPSARWPSVGALAAAAFVTGAFVGCAAFLWGLS